MYLRLGVRPVALDPYDHMGRESGSVEQEFVFAAAFGILIF
jgi:hypothetical protein